MLNVSNLLEYVIICLQLQVVCEAQFFAEYFDHVYIAAMKFIIFIVDKWTNSSQTNFYIVQNFVGGAGIQINPSI